MRSFLTLLIAILVSLLAVACWTQFEPPPEPNDDDDDTSVDDDDTSVDDDDTSVDDDDTSPTGCVEAATLTCGEDFPANNNSPGSTDSVLSYSCSTLEFSGPEYAIRWDASHTGPATVEVSGIAASEDLDLFVLADPAGTGCDPDACIGSSNNVETTESVTFDAVQGQSYYFVVDGYSESISNFVMSLDCDPTGDDDDDDDDTTVPDDDDTVDDDDTTEPDDDDAAPNCSDPPLIGATVTLTDPLGAATTSFSTSAPLTVNVEIENTGGDAGTTSFNYPSDCIFTWALKYTNGNPVDGGPDTCVGGLNVRDYSCGGGPIFGGDVVTPVEGVSGNPLVPGTYDLEIDTLYFGTSSFQVTVP